MAYAKLHIITSLILVKNGNILLLKRKNVQYRNGYRCLPGGHVDQGESLYRATVREINEELGIRVRIRDFERHIVMHNAKTSNGEQRIHYHAICRVWEGDIVNNEPDKCEEMAWFPMDKLPDNTIPHIREVLNALQRGWAYLEIGFADS